MDVDAIGCDMLTGTGRKFLRAPRGTGFLWVRPAALDRLDPFVAEIGSATWDGRHGFTWAAGARRFATWEHSYVNVLGLGAAVRQALDLGLEAIGQRAAALGARLRGQLAGLPGVSVHDLGQIRCAIVTAKIDQLAAPQAAQALARAGVNVSTTVPEHNPLDTQDRGVHPLIRFSPHYYNTDEEIDRTTELVAGLARLPMSSGRSGASLPGEITRGEGPPMTEPKTDTLPAPGAVLHYDIRSADSSTYPALLIIGSPMGAAGFVTLAGHFADRTVVTYDPRGSGRSQRTDGALETTPVTGRSSVAVAERLGTAPVTFPGGHDGFLGGEYGSMGQPDAFAAALHTLLDHA